LGSSSCFVVTHHSHQHLRVFVVVFVCVCVHAPVAMAESDDQNSIWQDLRDACPIGLPSKTIVLKTISLLSSIIVYVALPSLRVENGSVDSCDPIRTYGEIPEEGMELLMKAADSTTAARKPREAGDFLDIGSGHGVFVRWACKSGGFSTCWGVEIQAERHKVAVASQQDDRVQGVHLLLGDIRHHSQTFDNVSLVYWNNLCYATDVAEAVAHNFATRAPANAELWSLAALPYPLPESVERIPSDLELVMPWREELPYKPYRYRKKEGTAMVEDHKDKEL